MILIIIFQGCGDDRAAGEESTLSLLHAYLRLVQVSSCFAADYNKYTRQAAWIPISLSQGSQGADAAFSRLISLATELSKAHSLIVS